MRHYAVTVATLEDKIVQRAVVGVLNAVYEADFRGFSYLGSTVERGFWTVDGMMVQVSGFRLAANRESD
jgi:hypothetical protein